METYAQETIEITRSKDWETIISDEVIRLLNSGAVGKSSHSRAMIIGVALENIADNYLRGDRKMKDYLNLKKF